MVVYAFSVYPGVSSVLRDILTKYAFYQVKSVLVPEMQQMPIMIKGKAIDLF